MEIKYFQSKYNALHRDQWKDIIDQLGVHPYDVIVPCELAVILGGFFENPSAFDGVKTLVFYKKEYQYDIKHKDKKTESLWMMFEKAKLDSWVSILSHYFNKMVDLTGLNPKEAAERIKKVIETYQS